MGENSRQFGRTARKLLLWTLAVLIAIILALQLSVLAGINWLQSGDGQAWLQGKLNNVVAQTGLELSFDRFSYSFPQAIAVQDIALHDRQGNLIAGIDKARIGIGVLPLAARTLSLSLKTNTVTLHQLPAEGTPEHGEKEAEPFTMPDLFFTEFHPDIDIGTLNLKGDLFGLALTLSPHLEGRITLDDAVNFKLQTVEDRNEAPAWFPRKTMAEGSFSSQSAALLLKSFTAASPSYDVQGKGELAFSGEPAAYIAIEGEVSDLAPLTGMIGQTTFSGTITGKIASPAFTLEGTAYLALLENFGLATLGYRLETDNLLDPFSGRFDLQSQYRQLDIQLAGLYDYQAPMLLLSALQGGGPQLALSGGVRLHTGSMLADGALRIEAESLQPYGILVGTELGGHGIIAIDLSAGAGQQSAVIDADINLPRIDGITASHLNGRAAYVHFPGLWPQSLNADIKGMAIDGRPLFENLSATLDEQDSAYSLALQGQGGVLEDLKMQGTATLSRRETALPALSGIDLNLNAGRSSLAVRGMLSEQQVDLTMAANDFALGDLPAFVPDMLLRLRATGTGHISGLPGNPQADFALAFTPLTVRENITAIRLSVAGIYREDELALEINGEGNTVDDIFAELRVPVAFALLPFRFELTGQSPLSGHAAFHIDSAAVSDLFLPPTHFVSGQIQGRAEIGGFLADPAIDGTLAMRDGAYSFTGYGIQAGDITLGAHFDATGITLENFSASDGEGGSLRAAGQIAFEQTGTTSLDIDMENFHFFRSDRIDGVISADLALAEREDGYLLRGAVPVHEIAFTIPARFQTGIPELNIVETGNAQTTASTGLLERIALDVKIEADNRIFVRGWGLDTELAGNILLTGTLADPQLNGTLEAVRGRYEEFGRRFDLARAEIYFRGRTPPSPYLDVEAVTELDDITASINLTGRLNQPAVTFSSNPDLPEDEVMSHILFGRSIGQITPFQALKLKQTLDRLSGRGSEGFDPLETLQSATGLDEIALGTAGGETTLGVGKYLSDEIYLELEKGQAGESAANLEIELTPRITLESTVGQNAHSGAGIFWDWDY